MGYLSDLLGRTDLQHITEYILEGNILAVVQPGTMEERLEAAEGELWRLVREAGGEELAERVYHCCAVCEGVYAEMGVCAGASLAARLLCAETVLK